MKDGSLERKKKDLSCFVQKLKCTDDHCVHTHTVKSKHSCKV